MTEIMTPHEFKHSLLKLADPDDRRLISERVIVRHLAAVYIDADEAAQRDCSVMLRQDLTALGSAQTDQEPE